MIWGEVPRGLVIIIVVLFKKKNDIFFKAVKAADDIPGELGKLWRGGILSFQRLTNDRAQQPGTCLLQSWIRHSLLVPAPWARGVTDRRDHENPVPPAGKAIRYSHGSWWEALP